MDTRYTLHVSHSSGDSNNLVFPSNREHRDLANEQPDRDTH